MADLRRKTEDGLFSEKSLCEVNVAVEFRKAVNLNANLQAQHTHTAYHCCMNNTIQSACAYLSQNATVRRHYYR